MERNIKNQKGITLVALVITIIVMLILVAVSVTVAINGGLFTQAKEAGNAWEAKSAEEANGNIVQVKNDDGTITTTTIDGAITSLSGTTTQEPETNPEIPDEPQIPVETISFRIEGSLGVTQYETTAGTTWRQWVETDAPDGFAIDDDGRIVFVQEDKRTWLGYEGTSNQNYAPQYIYADYEISGARLWVLY